MDNIVGITALDKSIDLVEVRDGIMLGAADLVKESVRNPSNRGTAITAATSLGLCLINRIMKTASGGKINDEDSLLHRKEDDGILSMISNNLNREGEGATSYATEQRLAQRRARGLLSPRMLIVQASEDCTLDYNAFMNCVFAANKSDVVIDGCYMPSLGDNFPPTSTFLEQATDRTGGVFSKPTVPTQIRGGLTEVFMTVFLPPLGIRKEMNLLKGTEIDFRARCFETGVSLTMGMVCNLCLSIFKDEPKGGQCLTCGAQIMVNDICEDSEEKKRSDNGLDGSIDADRSKRARYDQ